MVVSSKRRETGRSLKRKMFGYKLLHRRPAKNASEKKFDKKKAKCFYCKKIGHVKSECPVLADKEAGKPLNQ